MSAESTAAGFTIASAAAVAQVILRPYRAIFVNSAAEGGQAEITEIIADAVIEERGTDEMVITDHPVEQGTSISDHAYKEPAVLHLIYAWSASGVFGRFDPQFLQKLYAKLLALQAARAMFSVYTGQRLYQNMLLKQISKRTTKETENALVLDVICREVLLAHTSIVSFGTSSANQANPQNGTGPSVSRGPISARGPL